MVRIRRNIELDKKTVASGRAVAYDGRTLLYENYKEPLKAIEKSKGYGYYGTVALTDDGQFVQCHVCGNLFVNLSVHVRRHNLLTEEYKETYGLSKGTALISETERRKRQERVVHPFNGELPDHLVEYNRRVQAGEIKHPGNKAKDGGWSLERRNKEGMCPNQVLEKIKELAVKLGHTPSLDEFKAEYKGRYIGSITYQHGTYLKAVEKLGVKSAKELKEHTDEDLLQALLDFKKRFGRIPMTSDFKRGLLPSRGTYFAHFGSLNNARIEAGLNAVIAMPFGQIMELTPEQYADYQKGHSVNEVATKQRQRRAKRRLIEQRRTIWQV